MVEAEATQGNDAPESAPAASTPDWSELRGFQFLAASGAETPADPEAYARELVKELAVRVARFSQSVDDSIVLASDGVFRWLGDPVARLVGGDDILKPRAILLAHEALTAADSEAAQGRLALWIAAHVRKVLGPLEALAEPGAVAESARELAQRVAQALGVLERERVRQQVKGLDQSARSALRKLGVRFGAFYIYVPALLKPGARTLCSQLWSLRRGVEPGSERLLAFAASGRTSFAAEAPLGADTYRVAGFRLCGDRVVRVDIIERLTDLIRAAIPDHMRPGGRPPSDAYGFVITPQMTSLTGCAGESFASILRSLGFESHKVKKSEYEAATRKASLEPIAQPAPPIPDALVAETVSENNEAVENVEVLSEGSVESEPGEAAEPAAPTLDAAPDTAPEVETAPLAETPIAEIQANPVGVAEPATAESPQEGEAVAAAAESVEASAAVEDEEIEIWRPAPRRRPQPSPRASAATEEGGAVARPPRHHREPRRSHGRDAGPRPAPAEVVAAPTSEVSTAAPNEPRRYEGRRDGRQEGGGGQRNEGRRPHGFKGPRNEEARTPDGPRGGRDSSPPPKKEPRPQVVDMDSPFAKLLALKPLLERRDKRP